jgi:hypothetical protein
MKNEKALASSKLSRDPFTLRNAAVYSHSHTLVAIDEPVILR